MLFTFFISLTFSAVPNFSFHIPQEPASLNPATISGIDLKYFYSNLYEGLYRYDDDYGLVPVGAAGPCTYDKSTLICKLAKVLWSDGTPVTAEHYVQAFRYLIDPKNKSREAGQLLSLEKSRDILTGKAKPEELGVIAISPTELHFKFIKPDYDFIAKLTSPALRPWKTLPDKKNSITNGPYKIKDWIPGQRILLEKNPYYKIKNPNTPDVEIFFFAEDITAVNFYDIGKMTFLRRLPTDLKLTYKEKPGYFEYSTALLDYVGFGPELAPYPELRKALALSMNFQEFEKLFDSAKRPGCSGIPKKMVSGDACIDFSLTKSKAALEKFNKTNIKVKLYLLYAMSGDDIRRGSEWMQNQWKKNLGLNIELRTTEQGMYVQTLTHSPPPIFKKLLSLDRPTCLAAFESFRTGHPDNYIQLKSKKYDAIIDKIESSSNPVAQKKLCAKALSFLTQDYWIIPQGAYRIGGVANPRFHGWKINSMNQLDLSNLTYQ